MVKKPLGRAIRRPNSRCFDPNDTHAEQDQAVFVGHGQIEVSLIPVMLGDISHKLACAFDRSALGVVKGWKIQFRPVNDSWERYSVYSPIA